MCVFFLGGEVTMARQPKTGVDKDTQFLQESKGAPAAGREVSGCKTGRGQGFFVWGVGVWGVLPWPVSPTLKLTRPCTVST